MRWVIIQAQIRNKHSYSGTDSEKLDISLSNQIIDEKTSLQKFVILLIIRGVSPT